MEGTVSGRPGVVQGVQRGEAGQDRDRSSECCSRAAALPGIGMAQHSPDRDLKSHSCMTG